MDFFDVLTLVGGLALFLFGMNIMGSSLERRAGHGLKSLLEHMTSNPFKGFLLGVGITALMQSSSVTTVMVVGFVNSGLMTLGQSISIIMGANLGASITSWILSLSGVDGENFFIQIFKPSSFTPILALIGVILHNFTKNSKKKDTGMILLGFAVLMFGMETMSGSVSGLRDSPSFTHMIEVFSNPIVGVLVGTIITAIIQSSSASIGILQALSMTGSITYGTAVPIIMGQNIGTCISALISCIGASKNAQRAAVIHLMFNIVSTLICLPLYYLVYSLFKLSFAEIAVNPISIAMVNTVYKIISIIIIAPFAKYFEPLACFIIKDSSKDDEIQLLDERLLATPSVAITRCNTVLCSMAELAVIGVQQSIKMIKEYDTKSAEEIINAEAKVDYYEDKLGSYLVKLSSQSMSQEDSNETAKLLHLISDFERISDHSVNILYSAEEIHSKRLRFSEAAQKELNIITKAVSDILDLALAAFRDDDMHSAVEVEPLEQVVDNLKEIIRSNHITRLQNGICTIELGFILTDLLTNLERVSDHCSNIAGCILEMTHEDLDLHEYLHKVRHNDSDFASMYNQFCKKYIPAEFERKMELHRESNRRNGILASDNYDA